METRVPPFVLRDICIVFSPLQQPSTTTLKVADGGHMV